jgi:hypothetical protein
VPACPGTSRRIGQHYANVFFRMIWRQWVQDTSCDPHPTRAIDTRQRFSGERADVLRVTC